MAVLFETFLEWKEYCDKKKVPLFQPVLDYEIREKERTQEEIEEALNKAYFVMRDAVKTGLNEDMTSRSGMIENGGKKVKKSPINVLSEEFKLLIARALAAKEVNSCMGRVVAAPTAGASGILPGVLVTLQEIHSIPDKKIHEALLISAGIALIMEKKSGIAGAVGGCQAETGTAAAMAAGAITYCLGGSIDVIFNAVAITTQCMLGLVCDPVAGLVEVPCVVRNASAAAIANSSSQIALANVSGVIPVDECVDAMGEVGQSMEDRYKETAMGGLAATPTGKAISKRVLISDIDIIDSSDE
ncbi:L-serine ammonia-lyase, iron-sulfur-dependent, subunit alpha [Flammeovirga kamogawensis]|uniref:L-serine dehydratase n=1 Tax=Flammeovirga kamogawensis TaxID=373891 RepID=A0ABX8GQP2_9BACT|nr:L-serine ammonia-lyase, iron-sulfur-dependent, subunit alpha [Flammeovirga kamogawensis]MBB6462080.1 L-serine dehydratase [Flammeovirga kamogawensis]QWG05816.1 L-serine ammonia-lyase, iron-sulfur-dependent, subunit alpha [Flammeovirga kamogawensis]TRX67643.1 L-serine ammonia-lyase, iron-sulfur-dependent, subunit alpha [Flammeovirga kamogawensis]